jgi:hypothetical protein
MAVCFYRGRGLNNGGEVQFVVVSVWESGEHWMLEGCKTASGVLSTRVCCWVLEVHGVRRLTIVWEITSVWVQVHVIPVLLYESMIFRKLSKLNH